MLSSEQFTTSVRDSRQFLYLKKFVERYFSDIKVVMYIRAQESWINSRVSQCARGGVSRSFDQLLKSKENDYLQFLKPWWECFGKERISMRILDKKYLVDGDLISDFMHVIDGAVNSELAFPKPTNESLSNDAIQFLQVFNKIVPRYIDPKTVNTDRDGLMMMMEKFSVGKEKSMLSQEQVLEIRSRYEKSNDQLREMFFPDRDELFPLDLSKCGENVEFSIESAVSISAFLWERQQERIRNLKRKARLSV